MPLLLFPARPGAAYSSPPGAAYSSNKPPVGRGWSWFQTCASACLARRIDQSHGTSMISLPRTCACLGGIPPSSLLCTQRCPCSLFSVGAAERSDETSDREGRTRPAPGVRGGGRGPAGGKRWSPHLRLPHGGR